MDETNGTVQAEQDSFEAGYTSGREAASVQMVALFLRDLDPDSSDPHVQLLQKVKELAEIRQALRIICREHGDLDWADDLHLADVISKHLAPHLEARGDDRDNPHGFQGDSSAIRIDPDTGWAELWSIEWGEGGWMLVRSSKDDTNGPIGGPFAHLFKTRGAREFPPAVVQAEEVCHCGQMATWTREGRSWHHDHNGTEAFGDACPDPAVTGGPS